MRLRYGHDIKTAREVADAAMRLMSENRVPYEPANYTVWYGYVTGIDATLRKAIDSLLTSEEEFTAARNVELYEKFFGVEADSQALREASGRIESAVSKVLKILGSAEAETSRYGQALESYSGRLDRPLKLEEVRDIVGGIAAETRQMLARQQELDRALVRSTKEIRELRANLQSVQLEALTDPLTGIANRKQFDLRLKEIAADAVERESPVSLLLADIDFFKAFNDTYGHAVGDQVLRLVAKTMVEQIKGRDLAARLGGEEFAILLPDTAVEDAVTVGNQIRMAVGLRKIIVRSTGENLGSVQISLGVAEYLPSEPLSTFVERADRALYSAKRNGRNQVFADRTHSTKLKKSA